MEIELKYGISSREIADQIWEDEYLASMEERDSRETLHMKAAYFDTEDGALSSSDIAFRVRSEGHHTFATVKWGGRNEGALHTRQEINVPAPDDTYFIMPDVSIFKESEIGQELMQLVEGKQLISNVEMNVIRRRFRIDSGDAIVEVSVDNGEIITANGTDIICEVELELFSGSEEALMKISEELKKRYNLVPEGRSKYARGLALIRK